MKIKLEEIVSDSSQPRKTFKEETLQELSDSYKTIGLIQPITVRPYNGKYMIVVGERRYRAALLNGQEEIDCMLIEDIGDKQVREMQFAENAEHEEVPPLELGEAFFIHRKKYDLTQEQLSKVVGLSQQTIGRYEALHNNLTPGVKLYVKSGELGIKVAEIISTIKDKDRQEELAKLAVDKELTRDTISKLKPLVESQKHRSAESIYASQVELESKIKEEPVDREIEKIIEQSEYPVKLIELKMDCEQWILAANNLDLELLNLLNGLQKSDLLAAMERNEQATLRIKDSLSISNYKLIEG